MAAGTVVPIQVTGPPANRFNLVIAGDGYTEAEQAKFRQQVDKHLNIMWSIEPYKSYRNYINVYAIKIVSAESGIDCDPEPDLAAQGHAAEHGLLGRLQRVERPAPGHRRQRRARPATRRSPRATSANAASRSANSDTYGGAGGTNATASGGNALSALISPHELGHSLGGLQDEYDYYHARRARRRATRAASRPRSTTRC